jgi:hypothetical protein
MNLFECGKWPGTADPNKAAVIVTTWLRDSGFAIVDAEYLAKLIADERVLRP